MILQLKIATENRFIINTQKIYLKFYFYPKIGGSRQPTMYVGNIGHCWN